ncbi:hypothetical protein AB0N17_20150 [Streptomyces sp. NPDC051133]|uniref:hypothetical protein n=1 Tax=Streptomyces sp. NPDC051133 TaxID=3155521 RepID=UPI003425AD08
MTNRSRAPQATPTRSARARLLLWALALLAVAFPAAVGPALHLALGTLAFAVAHGSTTCTVAALVLLARAFPSVARGIGRFLGVGARSAVRTVFA